MTSLFEQWPEQPGEMPVGMVTQLVEEVGRAVSLLEFVAVDERRPEVPQTGLSSLQQAAEAAEVVLIERAAQVRVMIDAAREEAVAVTRRELAQEHEARLQVERERVERVCAEFARDRQRYFGAAETQVVRLALAVARRVLEREVAGDSIPMFAMVKAALGKMQDGSATVLRVRRAEAAEWEEIAGAGAMSIQVLEDERLRAGEVVLETGVGRVELGVEVQMEEIERGFGELTRRQGE